jgi:hypothetical protein
VGRIVEVAGLAHAHRQDHPKHAQGPVKRQGDEAHNREAAPDFYGMLGGFLVQGVLGGVAAVSVRSNADHGWIHISVAAVIAAVPAVLILSVLDWIIGTW